MDKINTVYDLKRAYYEHHPDGHFFDRKTLAFFGESMKTMKFSKVPAIITDDSGKRREVYLLYTYQKKHPLGPRWSLNFFDIHTLQQVFKEGE